MADDAVEVLWALGETHWRDLRSDIAAAGQVTTATAHSVHLLDVHRGVAIRLPGPWANQRHSDAEERPMRSVRVATPCGLVLDHGDARPSKSTPLLLLLGRWLDVDTITGPVAALHRRHAAAVPFAAGHPDEACGALYCCAKWGQ